MRIFLCSYFAGVESAFREYVGSSLAGQQVVFVTTASLVEEVTFYVDKARQVFERLGATLTVLDIAAEDTETCVSRIADADLLYVAGGNTFYLLQAIQDKNLTDFIVARVRGGMIYVGESAGAMIASSSVDYAQLMDDRATAPALTDLAGLGLIDFYPLVHYRQEPFIEATDAMMSTYSGSLDLVPISNRQAIRVEGNVYTIV